MIISRLVDVLCFLILCIFSESDSKSSDRKQKINSSKVETDQEEDDFIQLNL